MLLVRTVTGTQNAVGPDARPYVPTEMAEGDFRPVIYHCIKTPTMSEFEYNVFIYNIIYIQHIIHHTNTL